MLPCFSYRSISSHHLGRASLLASRVPVPARREPRPPGTLPVIRSSEKEDLTQRRKAQSRKDATVSSTLSSRANVARS